MEPHKARFPHRKLGWAVLGGEKVKGTKGMGSGWNVDHGCLILAAPSHATLHVCFHLCLSKSVVMGTITSSRLLPPRLHAEAPRLS